MSEPVRWRSPDSGASPEARELFRHALGPKALDAAARSRNAAAVAKIAAGAVPVVAGAKIALSAKLFSSTKALVGIGLATVVAATVTTAVVRRHPAREAAPTAVVRVQERPTVPSRAARTAPTMESVVNEPVAAPSAPRVNEPAAAPSAPRVNEPVVAPAPVAAAPVVAPVIVPSLHGGATETTAPAQRGHVVPGHSAAVPTTSASTGGAPLGASAPVGTSAAPSGLAGVGEAPAADSPALSTGDPLAREERLLELARAQMDINPEEALRLVERHEREFARIQQMAGDREFIAVQALQNLGRFTEARARATAFVREFPTHPNVRRVRRILDAR